MAFVNVASHFEWYLRPVVAIYWWCLETGKWISHLTTGRVNDEQCTNAIFRFCCFISLFKDFTQRSQISGDIHDFFVLRTLHPVERRRQTNLPSGSFFLVAQVAPSPFYRLLQQMTVWDLFGKKPIFVDVDNLFRLLTLELMFETRVPVNYSVWKRISCIAREHALRNIEALLKLVKTFVCCFKIVTIDLYFFCFNACLLLKKAAWFRNIACSHFEVRSFETLWTPQILRPTGKASHELCKILRTAFWTLSHLEVAPFRLQIQWKWSERFCLHHWVDDFHFFFHS